MESSNEIEETKNQVYGIILYLLVCPLGLSCGWGAEIPDVGWLLWVIRIRGDFAITIGHSTDSGSLQINKWKITDKSEFSGLNKLIW